MRIIIVLEPDKHAVRSIVMTFRNVTIVQEVNMFKSSKAFSGFSVDDLATAKRFYGETLGLEVRDDDRMSLLHIRLGSGAEAAVDALVARGVRFERYDGEIATGAKGIMRSPGYAIAWFKDPAGNILSVVGER